MSKSNANKSVQVTARAEPIWKIVVNLHIYRCLQRPVESLAAPDLHRSLHSIIEKDIMDFLEQYLDRANEIIGDRTKEEERYDKEVLRWLRKGKGIKKAIKKANRKYPKEALEIDDDNINDVAAHYDYLMEHDKIIRKISH